MNNPSLQFLPSRTREKRTLYLLFTVLWILSIAWIFFFEARQHTHGMELCAFKRLTGIACPSCGITRSVVALIHGNYGDAFFINPLGYLASLLLLLTPGMLIADLITYRSSFYTAYKKLEQLFHKRSVFISFFILILINWIWNICKGI